MTELYQRHFELDRKRKSQPAWWSELRDKGLQRFFDLGFPTTDLEEWRYTSVASIADTHFALAGAESVESLGGVIENDFVQKSDFYQVTDLRIACVNGRFSPALSQLQGIPAGVFIGSLEAFAKEKPEILEEYLSSTAGFEKRAFVALNTAFLNDGAVVYVPKGLTVEKPIYINHFSWSEGVASVSHPRNLFILGENARATVVEIYTGGNVETYLTNAVTEAVLGEAAQLDYYKIQEESGKAYHVGSIDAHQRRDSRFSSLVVSLGGALSRHEVNTGLQAEGAECSLNGLYMVTGRQHVDNQTNIEHAKPHGTSSELYKGILDGQSRGVFNGRVHVHPHAQKTSSRQTNKNLILSEEALINTKPLLEIFANDVKCNHGATIGRLDENQVFYLRARGLSDSHARSLLTYAFASELVQQVKVPRLKDALEKLIFRRLLSSEILNGGLS